MSYCHLDVVENGFNFVSLFYVVNCQFETNQGSFAGIFQSTEGDVLSWLFIGGHFCLSKIYQKKKMHGKTENCIQYKSYFCDEIECCEMYLFTFLVYFLAVHNKVKHNNKTFV